MVSRSVGLFTNPGKCFLSLGDDMAVAQTSVGKDFWMRVAGPRKMQLPGVAVSGYLPIPGWMAVLGSWLPSGKVGQAGASPKAMVQARALTLLG